MFVGARARENACICVHVCVPARPSAQLTIYMTYWSIRYVRARAREVYVYLSVGACVRVHAQAHVHARGRRHARVCTCAPLLGFA